MTDIDLHFDVRAVRIIWRGALLVHLDNDRTCEHGRHEGRKGAGRGQRDAEERAETQSHRQAEIRAHKANRASDSQGGHRVRVRVCRPATTPLPLKTAIKYGCGWI